MPHSSLFVVCWFLMRRHYKVLMGRISIIIVFPAHSIIYTPMNKIITSPVFLLKLVYLILPFMQQLFRTSQNCENEVFSGFPVIFFFLKTLDCASLLDHCPLGCYCYIYSGLVLRASNCHKFVPLNKTLSPQPAQQLEDEVEMHVIEVTKMQNDSPVVDQCDF